MSQTTTTHATPDNTTKNSGSDSKKGGLFAGRMKGWREILPAAASWEDVTYSATVLAVVNITFLLFWVTGTSLTSLLCYTLGTGMLVGWPYAHFTVHGRHMAADSHLQLVSEETIKKHVAMLHEFVGKYGSEVRTLFCWINPRRSLFVTIGAFVVGYLFTMMSWSFVAFCLMNIALVRKPTIAFYKKNLSKQVQPYLDQASAAFNGVLSKIPRMSDATAAGKKKI